MSQNANAMPVGVGIPCKTTVLRVRVGTPNCGLFLPAPAPKIAPMNQTHNSHTIRPKSISACAMMDFIGTAHPICVWGTAQVCHFRTVTQVLMSHNVSAIQTSNGWTLLLCVFGNVRMFKTQSKLQICWSTKSTNAFVILVTHGVRNPFSVLSTVLSSQQILSVWLVQKDVKSVP